MSRVSVAIIGTHIAPSVGYGGVAPVFYNYAAAWARSGYDISICSSSESKGKPIRREDLNLPSYVRVYLYKVFFFRRWGFGLGAIPAIFSACRNAAMVHICGVATWPSTLAAVMSIFLGVPFTVGVHGGLMAGHVAEIKSKKPYKWLFYKFLTLPTLRRAKFILVTSELERNGVISLLPNAICYIIPNGLFPVLWRQAPPQRQPRLTCCFIGRFEKDKGILRFSQVWLKTCQPGERLLIIGGGDGVYAKKLEALVRRSNGSIEMLDHLDQTAISSVITQSDFLVLPSGIEGNNARENFGNVVAEAMMSGRPAAVAKGLAWDFLEKQGLGFVFEHTDLAIEGTFSRMRSMVGEDYARMCVASRAYAETNFDLERTAEKLWGLLTQPNASGPGSETIR